MRTVLAAALVLLLAGPALAALPPAPPPAQPRTFEPPKARIDEDPNCLATTVEPNEPHAGILLRNTCAVRVNFALCVRRSDDAKPLITHGSLSPAAVYGQDVAFTPKTRHFTHRSTFCSGVTCQVTEPDC